MTPPPSAPTGVTGEGATRCTPPRTTEAAAPPTGTRSDALRLPTRNNATSARLRSKIYTMGGQCAAERSAAEVSPRVSNSGGGLNLSSRSVAVPATASESPPRAAKRSVYASPTFCRQFLALLIALAMVSGVEGADMAWVEGTGGGTSWLARFGHAAASFDDGVVVTTGGMNAVGTYFSDVQTTTSGGTALAVVAPTAFTARALHAIARVPSDPDAFLMVGGQDLSGQQYLNDALLTTDRGASFVTQSTAVFTGIGRLNSGLIATGTSSFVAVGGYDGVTHYNEVRRSVDLGVTWTTLRVNGPTSGDGTGGDSCADKKMWSQRRAFGYAYMLLRKRIVLAAGSKSGPPEFDAWGSDDGGVCWQQLTVDISGGGNGFYAPSLAVALLSGIEILVLAGGVNTGSVHLNTVYSSLDAGVTWELIANSGVMWQGRSFSTLVFDALNERLATLGGVTDSGLVNDFWTASATTLVTTVRLLPPHASCALLLPPLALVFASPLTHPRNSLPLSLFYYSPSLLSSLSSHTYSRPPPPPPPPPPPLSPIPHSTRTRAARPARTERTRTRSAAAPARRS